MDNGMFQKTLDMFSDYDVTMYTIDFKERPDLRGQYLVFLSPCLLMIKDNEVFHKEAGFFDFDKIKKALDRGLDSEN